MHNGTSAVVAYRGRSREADSGQTAFGTTALAADTWYQVGVNINVGGDTVTPFLNGVGEGGGSVTFGATTYTQGNPNSGRRDMVGCLSSVAAVPNSTNDQFDGDIAEVGVWASATAFSASDMASLGRGVLPDRVRAADLKLYMPLWGLSSPEPDLKSLLTGNITGTIAAANHAPVEPFSRRYWSGYPEIGAAPPAGVDHTNIIMRHLQGAA